MISLRVVRRYEAGHANMTQLENGDVILWNPDGDAVHIDREDLGALAREVAAAHVHAGRLKLDAK